MAIATLAEVYNNSEVFRGVVKIRKGLACRMILQSGDMKGVMTWFRKFVSDISRRVPPKDPSASRTVQVCEAAVTLTRESEDGRQSSSSKMLLVAAIPVVVAACVYVHGRR